MKYPSNRIKGFVILYLPHLCCSSTCPGVLSPLSVCVVVHVCVREREGDSQGTAHGQFNHHGNRRFEGKMAVGLNSKLSSSLRQVFPLAGISFSFPSFWFSCHVYIYSSGSLLAISETLMLHSVR